MKYFGVCYYPELYDAKHREAFLKDDIRLMKNAGFNVVRIAEFSWCLMEPEEGRYDFEWLDHIISVLGENGIYSIVCTPTAAPPVWMAKKYPEICTMDSLGTRRTYGGRHFKCNSNSIVREKTIGICHALGAHYGKDPHVLGFMVDNELTQEGSGRCMCPECRARFIEYCRNKYSSIEELNSAWRTLFWGQTYTAFEDIEPPFLSFLQKDRSLTEMKGADNPSLRLEFDRFSSDASCAYYELQRGILAQYTEKPITHNTTHFANNKVDFRKMLERSEVAGVDHYPAARSESKNQSALIYSYARNLLGRNFWLLETLCGGGHGNWAGQGMAMGTPDTFRLNMNYAFCSGADVITAFKWIIFEGGYEQLGSALLDADRVPRRRYGEFVQAGKDLKKYEAVLDKTAIRTDVAVVYDLDSLWSSEIKPIHKSFKYTDYLHSLFGSLHALGINVDLIDATRPLDAYRLVILPFGMVMSGDFSERVRRYVESGGTFVAQALGFAKDSYGNAVIGESLPLSMSDFFGAVIGEVEPVFPETVTKVRRVSSEDDLTTRFWQEFLEPAGAEILYEASDTFRAGTPVCTSNRYGAGEAIYLGTAFDEKDNTAFFKDLLSRLGIRRAPITIPDGIDVILRETESGIPYYFVFNSLTVPAVVPVSGTFTDLMTSEVIDHEVTIPAKGFAVLY